MAEIRKRLIDIDIVSLQLKTKITNFHSVIKKCKYGYPMAIQSLPYKKEKNRILPFPTTFWLTCPFLRRKIGKLESEGYIKKAKDLLKNADILKNFEYSRKITINTRMEMVKKDFKYYDYLKSLGIGGSKDDTMIKCLHLHVANYFKTGNPIGKWVLEKLDNIECEDCECCEFQNKI